MTPTLPFMSATLGPMPKPPPYPEGSLVIRRAATAVARKHSVASGRMRDPVLGYNIAYPERQGPPSGSE